MRILLYGLLLAGCLVSIAAISAAITMRHTSKIIQKTKNTLEGMK